MKTALTSIAMVVASAPVVVGCNRGFPYDMGAACRAAGGNCYQEVDAALACDPVGPEGCQPVPANGVYLVCCLAFMDAGAQDAADATE